MNRTATPFVVVVFHRLMFVCDKYTSSGEQGCLGRLGGQPLKKEKERRRPEA